MTACHYQEDKLVIINNSQNAICYETLIKKGTTYFEGSAGGKIGIKSSDSPAVRGSIASTIRKYSSDMILYVVYYRCKDADFIYRNTNFIVNDKRFKVDKYSLKELDSINWVIRYPRFSAMK